MGTTYGAHASAADPIKDQLISVDLLLDRVKVRQP